MKIVFGYLDITRQSYDAKKYDAYVSPIEYV